jgi:hypothetical protein
MNKFLKISINTKPANFVTYFYPETKEFKASIFDKTEEEKKLAVIDFWADRGVDYAFIQEKDHVLGYSLAIIKDLEDSTEHFFLIPIIEEKEELITTYLNGFDIVTAIDVIPLDDAKVLYYQYKG